jgi:CRISPR/Cas system CSM-associated protein Csm3 (group 7 of RAMP superfamily)
MPRIKVDLTLTFTTPPSVGAGGASVTLADKVVTRNARGQFIIPASQLKGKLRHACEQLLRSQAVRLCQPPLPEAMCPQIEDDQLPHRYGLPYCLTCQIFGSPGYPSRLRFFDLVAEHPETLPDETLRPMVSLNRRRRTAEEKRLFLIETAPHFSGLKFANAEAISGHLAEPSQLHLLLAGMRFLFAWGGGTSRGMGWGKASCLAWLDDQLIDKVSQAEVRKLCLSSK